MSVEISLANINPPVSSFSRAGRMAESLGGKKQVKTLAKAPPAPRDYLKVLTAGDLGGAEKGVSQSNDEEAYEKGDELCSSARDHPITVKRQTFVSAVEKELAFKAALHEFRPKQQGELPVPRLIPVETLVKNATAIAGQGQTATQKGKSQAQAVANSGAPVVSLNSTLKTPMKSRGVSTPAGGRHNGASPSDQRAASPDRVLDGFGSTQKVESAKEYNVSDSTPPVGHYHPKYGVLDSHEQTAFISKLRSRSPKKGATGVTPRAGKAGRHNATAGSFGVPSYDQSTLGGTMNGTLSKIPNPLSGTGDPANAATAQQSSKQQPAKIGTSAFLSDVPKGGAVLGQAETRRSQSVPLKEACVNEGHFRPPPNRSNVRMDRQLGRPDREKQMAKGEAGATDLAYYPKMKPFHSPALPFSGQVPRERDEGLPRTSHNVPTAQKMLPANYDLNKTKFKKMPCTTDFKKQVGREVDINNMILVKRSQTAAWEDSTGVDHSAQYSGVDEQSVIPLATSATRHTPTFKMGRVPGRKMEKPKAAHDVIYEVDYSVTDKKQPDTYITATAKRPKIGFQGMETLAIGVGKYDVDSKLGYRKTEKNIEIGRVVSRDQREKLASGHVDKLSNVVYDSDSAIKRTQEKRVPGNPFMSTHISRAKRVQLAASGELALLDKTYDWQVDSSHLKKGSIEFSRQVQREKHAGSSFANAMKRELSPALHD